VIPLLKPFIKDKTFTDVQRKEMYGISEMDFAFAEKLEEADVVVLTMAWNYYVKTEREDLATAFIKECAVLNKKVISVNTGDFGVRVPNMENLIVLRTSGYRSKFSENEYAIPVFIADPLKKYFNTDKIIQRPYNQQPLIGFCGQAKLSRFQAAKEMGNILLRNGSYWLGFSENEPQELLSSSFLRASVLKALEKSDDVLTNFIVRDKYRAGVTTGKETHSTTLEFYDNLKESEYVLCVRGAGNFSVRFYETLAMGRIPVLIDTDCALPLDDTIDWKKHVVWVEYDNRQQVAERVSEFHKNLSEKDFLDLQKTNRKLWEEHLTLDKFYHIFINNTVLIL
jgi:hypothetical protein